MSADTLTLSPKIELSDKQNEEIPFLSYVKGKYLIFFLSILLYVSYYCNMITKGSLNLRI